MNPIHLLDDANGSEVGLRGLQDLTRTALARKPAPPAPPKAQTPPPAPLTRPPQKAEPGRVFTSSPTLRQLMGEYNRSTSRTSPIKASAGIQPPGAHDFCFDRIDLIRVASIPGKILRPTRQAGNENV